MSVKRTAGNRKNEVKARQLAIAGGVVHLTSALAKELKLYPPEHGIPKQTLDKLMVKLEAMFANEDLLSFEIFQRVVVFDGEPLVMESIQFADLVEKCQRHRVHNFRFRKGVTAPEVELFASLLAEGPRQDPDVSTLAESLERERVTRVAVNFESSLAQKKPGETDAYGFRKSFDTYDDARTAVGDLDQQLLSKSTLDVEAAKAVVENLLSEILRDDQAMISLTALKGHDETTSVHSVNTCILALIIGQQLNLSDDGMISLGLSALLHDVGKVRLPGDILGKKGRLDEKEWALVQRHPLEGARILQALTGRERIAMVVAYEHHTGYDMSGYPHLTGKLRPHVFSRITQVADCFEAMTSDSRPYAKTVFSPDEALQTMLERPGFFDPVLMKLFVAKMGLYPIGTPVLLSTDDLAIVVQSNGTRHVARPVVKVIMDGQGRKVEPFLVDLSHEDSATIKRTLPPGEIEINLEEVMGASGNPGPSGSTVPRDDLPTD